MALPSSLVIRARHACSASGLARRLASRFFTEAGLASGIGMMRACGSVEDVFGAALLCFCCLWVFSRFAFSSCKSASLARAAAGPVRDLTSGPLLRGAASRRMGAGIVLHLDPQSCDPALRRRLVARDPRLLTERTAPRIGGDLGAVNRNLVKIDQTFGSQRRDALAENPVDGDEGVAFAPLQRRQMLEIDVNEADNCLLEDTDRRLVRFGPPVETVGGSDNDGWRYGRACD